MQSRAKEIGEDLEYRIVTGADDLRLVGDREAEWHDAKIDDDVPLDVKACAVRIPDGESTRRGRFYIKEPPHERLVAAGGVYLFAIYDDDREIIAQKRVPAIAIDDVDTHWMDAPDDRSFDRYAQVSWGKLFDPADVD